MTSNPTDRTIAELRALAEAPPIHGDLELFCMSIEDLQPAIAAALLAGLPIHELPAFDLAALRRSISFMGPVQADLARARLDLLITASRLCHNGL